MKLERLFGGVLFSILVLASCLHAAHSVSARLIDERSLTEVKRIFIESFPSEKREMQVESLTRELKQRGFEVVEDPSQADAILTGEAQLEIVLHGDGSIPDKSIFSYQLASSDKTIIWKHKVKFTSKSKLADDYAYAAKKIAEKLFRDKEKALKASAK